MKLILGGQFSGKHAFAASLGFAQEDFGASFAAPVLDSLNRWVQDQMQAGKDVLSSCAAELNKHPDAVVLCTEVGCGVVPMERAERDYREYVGRCAALAAGQAEEVYRLYAGIPTKIK